MERAVARFRRCGRCVRNTAPLKMEADTWAFPSSEHRAVTHLVIGPLTQLEPVAAGVTYGSSTQEPEIPLLPRVTIRKQALAPIEGEPTQGPTREKILVNFALPQLSVSIDKLPLDGLQLWADDLSQWMERTAAAADAASDANRLLPEFDGDNLIGSRFFFRKTKSLSSSTTGSSLTRGTGPKDGTAAPKSELSLSFAITEGESEFLGR